MDGDWIGLGKAIRARRESLGLSSRAALGDLAGVSEGTIKNLETAQGGKGFTRAPDSLEPVEHALEWSPGTALRILKGTEPTLLSASDGAPQPVQPTATDDPARGGRTLPVRVRHALETGEIFDADLISIRGLDLILIAKAGAYTGEDVDREVDGNGKDWDLIRELLRKAAREPDDTTPDEP